MAKSSRKKTARRTTTKSRTTKSSVNLKTIRSDLKRARAALGRTSAKEARDTQSDQAQLDSIIAAITNYCERDRRCGSTMIITFEA